MRSFLCAIAVLLMAACAQTANGFGTGSSHSNEAPVRIATVCELAHWGPEMAGVRVRVRAKYFTDFFHGAYLSDPECSSLRLEIGVNASKAYESIEGFEEYTSIHRQYYAGHEFSVDVTGIFNWEQVRIINAELPQDRQLRIPAHGTLSLLKVWGFEKPKKLPGSRGAG